MLATKETTNSDQELIMTEKDLDILFSMLATTFVGLGYSGSQAHSMSRAIVEIAYERFKDNQKRGIAS